MYKQIEINPQIKFFCTATDGNHGRAVAWVARKLKRKAIIYMPSWTVPERVKAISLIGTAFPMQVNEALLESAKSNPQIAINILTFMGYSFSSRLGGNKTPGMWMTESTKRLMQKSKKGIIYKDLKACSEFTDGLDKAKKVEAKVQLILGSNDFLTPRIKAQDLIDNFNQPLVEEIYGSGHSLMMEEPNKVLDYLIKLFKN